MRILMDTSGYSAFLRGHSEIEEVIRRAGQIALNAIVIGELHTGFLKGKHRAKNESELRQFLSSPRVNVLTVDEETAEHYPVILNALWKAGTPIPTNAVWIAASAMQYGLRLVTTDDHYRKVPQIMIEWFRTA